MTSRCCSKNAAFLCEIMQIPEKRRLTLCSPPDFFTQGRTKTTDCVIAFVCAALISPLVLLCGMPLYGENSAMRAEDAFLVCILIQQSRNTVNLTP